MSFLENIVMDVAGTVTQLGFIGLQVAKNMRITCSKTECYIAIHDYLKNDGDTSQIERYFLDSSESGQHKIMDKLRSCSGQIQKQVDSISKDIKQGNESRYGMFSARQTKEERLADTIDLKFRVDDLCCVLEKAVKDHKSVFKAA